MRRSLRRLFVTLSVFAGLSFLVILVNQTAQLVAMASTLSPLAGRVVLVLLVAAFLGAIAVPVALFMRLPAPLVPPSDENGVAFERHLDLLRRRLRRNRHVADLPIDDRAQVEVALQRLGAVSEDLTKRAAGRAFLVTAISQQGALDGVALLWIQLQLIWDIAHLYYQRPTLRDMVFLYANVLGTALLANRLEDVDLSEQLRPVMTSLMGSTVANLPGVQAFGSTIAQSTLTGAVNAFLTLRVGFVASGYCGSLSKPKRATLWSSAMAKASKSLGGIVTRGASSVTSAFLRASGKTVADAASGTVSAIAGVGKSAYQVSATAAHATADRVHAARKGVAGAARGFGRRPAPKDANVSEPNSTRSRRRKRRKKADDEDS